jgi:hypothetical protein
MGVQGLCSEQSAPALTNLVLHLPEPNFQVAISCC